ncbi:MAG TPA: DUF1893 domain-containing protein [Clostridia bacterium]|nr:DUF1893 domain-containing protein [Clostridia bacterium]
MEVFRDLDLAIQELYGGSNLVRVENETLPPHEESLPSCKDPCINPTTVKRPDLVIVRNGNVLAKRSGEGVRPLMEIVSTESDILSGSVMADRIVGTAVAMIAVHFQVAGVYGDVMSQGAVRLLAERNIPYRYASLTDYVKNRQGTGMCPIEEMASRSETVEELISNLQVFLGMKD